VIFELRRGMLLSFAVVASILGFAGVQAAVPEPARSLRILSDRPLPPVLVSALDVRWASDHSVYLSMAREGTVEASIDLDHLKVTPMIPKMQEPEGSFSLLLGASSEYLVTSGPFWITWRPIASPTKAEDAFDSIHDLDVAGDRLLILAARRGEKGQFAPEGAIAWLGSLRRGLSDLRPVAYDATGPGARNLGACSNFHMGGVRFLADGSFLVVPGVQPGILHYSSEGKLIHTWDSVQVGLDTDCASLSEEQVHRYAVDPNQQDGWLNQRRTLDEILPLPQGPGLVIRSVSGGQVHWDLKVLTQKGAIVSYRIPMQSQSELSHLKGDVRGNRIVFVMRAFKKDYTNREIPRLLMAEVPS
jgi:hypothetical protein